MARILIPYNSIIHSEDTDIQIINLISKIKEVFVENEVKIDYVFPKKVYNEKLNLWNNLYKKNYIYLVNEYDENTDYQEYIDNICEIAHKEKYDYIFIPSGQCSKVIAASLSVELQVGVTVDVINMCFEAKNLIYIRATSSKELLAYISCISSTEIATFKLPGSSDILSEYEDKCRLTQANNLINLYIDKNSNVEIVSKNNITIGNSDIVIGVGRGVSAKAYEKIRLFAEKNHIEIVTTKPCVEKGVFDHRKQVGQSGKNINPKLYVAIGISGAMQHIVGVLGCKYIIAINPDKQAPIHEYADMSIISEAEEIFV